MKRAIVFISLIAFVACSSSEENVSELAFNDQIWGKTYNAIAGKLQPQARGNVSISKLVGDSLGLTSTDAGKLIIFATRYTNDTFSADKVIYRYPHYNSDSVQYDLHQLEKLHFIQGKESGEYRLTGTGRNVIEYYWHLKREKAKTFDLLTDLEIDALYRVLRKMVDEALHLNDGFKNESIQHHQNSLPPNFEHYPKIVQVIDLLWQYIAFTNDTSHYKYDNYIAESDDDELEKFLGLFPLSKELMSATREGREYDLNRCYDHRVWRMGREGCDMAVDQLMEFGLVKKSDNMITQTSFGSKLSKEAEKSADLRRYSTWSTVTAEEYQAFKELVLRLTQE